MAVSMAAVLVALKAGPQVDLMDWKMAVAKADSLVAYWVALLVV
jgi:hypothetical protein